MQVVMVGLNHETTPIAIREMVAVPPEALQRALAAMRALPGVQEAAILSTCYRTELYAVGGSDLSLEAIRQFLPAFQGISSGTVTHRMYVHAGRAAVIHLCSVAAGLDSAIFGETQILGQVKEAYEAAAATGTLGPYLQQLFNIAIATAKQVHSETAIGLHPLSIGSVVVQMVRRVFGRPRKLQVLVLGTGKLGRLTVRHLVDAGIAGITVASRSPVRARRVAASLKTRCVCLEEVPEQLPNFQVVITATTETVLTLAQVSAACSSIQGPLLLLDLGVPRNIDPDVARLPQVLLLNLDDLKKVAAMNLESRRQELDKALQIIEQRVERYAVWVVSRKVVPLIRTLTEEGERIRRQELDRVRSLSRASGDQWEVVEKLTRSLTGRLIHEFIINLKRSVPGLDGGALDGTKGR